LALGYLKLFIVAAAFTLAGISPPNAQELSAERIAQQLLIERGFDIGTVDGIWGPRSAAAMSDLQRELGLPVTGLPDAATLEAMTAPLPSEDAVLSEQPASPEVIVAEPTTNFGGRVEPNEIIAEPAVESEDRPETEAVATRPIQEATATPMQEVAEPADFSFFLLVAAMTAVGAAGIFIFFSVRERRAFRRARSDPAKDDDDDVVPVVELRPSSGRLTTTVAPEPRRPHLTSETTATLRQHNAAVDAVVRARASEPPPRAASPRREIRSPWVPGTETVAVGNYRLKGFIYVGESLKPQNGWGERDNCLIVPSMPLAARADVSGQYLDYWPAYERISPSSRRAYLDWLASDRSNPETPVGYVFLYFYGLERRLMLDDAMEERDSIIAEVERLVAIYGTNGSFHRYSGELLSAARALGGRPSTDVWHPIGLGDVPIADRLELGRAAAAGEAISPALLLSLVANHPETRLRAPVRRLPELISQMFCSQVERDYPDGLRISLPRQPPILEVSYRAASSTFEVGVIGASHKIPDIAQLAEPLTYGRAVLDAVTDELDSYSREMGKANGTPVTIAGLSKLPLELRHQQAMAVAGDAIAKLNTVAEGRHLYRLADLLGLVGLKTDVSTKIGLRDLSLCLAGWGIGIVPDPHFAPKILAERDAVLVFRLDMTKPIETEPSDQYRLTYMALALGVVVANADGNVSDDERRTLSRLIVETPDLSEQERRRLVSDYRWLEANPLAVSDLRQFLKQSTPEFRKALMERLIPIAAADGSMNAGEVSVLEKLAKILDLDNAMIYQALHSVDLDRDYMPMVEAPRQGTGPAIPAQPQKRPTGAGVDAARLAEIRAETAHASVLLSEIFADDVPEPTPVIVPSTSVNGELDQRHRALLEELMTRSEWSEEDFGRLARQAGMMPGSAKSKLNDWSIEQFDELILEGEATIVINSSLILETA
jgi:uncharacterized tellurite resistance protein B-like protein